MNNFRPNLISVDLLQVYVYIALSYANEIAFGCLFWISFVCRFCYDFWSPSKMRCYLFAFDNPLNSRQSQLVLDFNEYQYTSRYCRCKAFALWPKIIIVVLCIEFSLWILTTHWTAEIRFRIIEFRRWKTCVCPSCLMNHFCSAGYTCSTLSHFHLIVTSMHLESVFFRFIQCNFN